jgi:hypothetical protein
MPSYVTPKKNTAFIFYIGLMQQADTRLLRANPTLAAADFNVSIDGGTLNALGTTPTVTPAAGRMVKISLSAAEMNGDNITVVCSDSAGAEWCDQIINIQTSARQVDDLAYPATTGRSLTVSSSGVVDANVTQIDALATSGNNATLNLKQLNIVNSTGSALIASSTGGNGSGIAASGNGSGEGISATGGSTGHGIEATGVGSGEGILATGGTTGIGLHAVGGATGFVAQCAGTNGNGMSCIGIGTGEGLAAAGGATGHGAEFTGGATSGDGIRATVTSGIEFNALPSFTVVSDAGNSATQVKTDRAETDNDNWIASLVVIRTGVLKGQVAKVSDYDGTTKIFTFDPGFTATPATSVSMSILNQ